jgi:hypothetical protein
MNMIQKMIKELCPKGVEFKLSHRLVRLFAVMDYKKRFY